LAKADLQPYIWVSIKIDQISIVRKKTTGDLYALKMVLKSTVQGDDIRFAQVLSERNILADMNHNFIV